MSLIVVLPFHCWHLKVQYISFLTTICHFCKLLSQESSPVILFFIVMGYIHLRLVRSHYTITYIFKYLQVMLLEQGRSQGGGRGGNAPTTNPSCPPPPQFQKLLRI